ncbi:hypothetical protein NDU88_006922 [Pleurodeles waltl]|uniref:Uncharacterized protein n=1 Tax=Pleurodeles waltl TaxID=8319 RepID=A0AAV7NUW7_PLEWA|nr:hypothetical protein NDU88_006922 [Pleurodeles waltl]
MREKVKVREAEKSNLILSFNSKEERLLAKQLLSLETLKRQAADSRALEQKVVYSHFQLRLRRSELAHARLLEDRELARKLASLIYRSGAASHEDTQGAMRRLLQPGQRSREASAPCRLRGASVPTKECEDEQAIQNPEAGIKQEAKAHFRKPEDIPGLEGGKLVRFGVAEPHVLTLGLERNLAKTGGLRPHTTAGTVNKKKSGSAAARRSASAIPMSTPLHPASSSKREAPIGLRPSSRALFLNTEDARQVQTRSLVEAQASSTREADFDGRVKRLVDLVKGMQQQKSAQLRDYYSSRLLTAAGPDLKEDNCVQDQQRWLPLGQEPNHRSITIRKLDTNFTRRDIPQDILLMESYNRVLTEENWAVRRWPTNDPYHFLT